MSGLNNFQEEQYQDRFQQSVLGGMDRFVSEVVPNNKNTIFVVVLLIIGGLWFWSTQGEQAETARQSQREELGKAMAYGAQGKVQEQVSALDAFLAKTTIDPIIQAKAALYRANIHYNKGENTKAIERFQQVNQLVTDEVLLNAAADHGIASAMIQKKQYAEAKTALEAFIAKYGKRALDPAKRYLKGAKDDFVPTLSSAYYKLALVEIELGSKDAAKSHLQNLVSAYPETNEAKSASKILESL